jgi:CIC family chloride channel protein
MRSALTTRRSSLPVLDEEGMLLGIVRFDEVRRILLASSSGIEDGTAGLCVSDVASAPPMLAGPGTSMDKVLAYFEQSGADELPFVGADSRFVGFISRSRALGAYRAKLLELSEGSE